MFLLRPLAVAVLLLTACHDATGPGTVVTSSDDDARLPAEMRAAYAEDAAVLALRHALGTGDPACSAAVEIPQDLVEALYGALVRVYNATELAARDSVVDIYAIHTLGAPPVHELLVGVTRNVAWPDAWRQGNRLTGNPDVDGLMETWDLDLWSFLDLTSLDFDLAVLRADRPLNTIGLAALFRSIEGVANAGPNSLVGDGNDIRAARDSAAWRLGYSVGFGDCPAGCIERTVWTFSVFDDGRVRYEGSTGRVPPI